MNDTILNLPARLRQHKRGHPSPKYRGRIAFLKKLLDALQAENEKLTPHTCSDGSN
jgi:hypothetical protein